MLKKGPSGHYTRMQLVDVGVIAANRGTTNQGYWYRPLWAATSKKRTGFTREGAVAEAMGDKKKEMTEEIMADIKTKLSTGQNFVIAHREFPGEHVVVQFIPDEATGRHRTIQAWKEGVPAIEFDVTYAGDQTDGELVENAIDFLMDAMVAEKVASSYDANTDDAVDVENPTTQRLLVTAFSEDPDNLSYDSAEIMVKVLGEEQCQMLVAAMESARMAREADEVLAEEELNEQAIAQARDIANRKPTVTQELLEDSGLKLGEQGRSAVQLSAAHAIHQATELTEEESAEVAIEMGIEGSYKLATAIERVRNARAPGNQRLQTTPQPSIR